MTERDLVMACLRAGFRRRDVIAAAECVFPHVERRDSFTAEMWARVWDDMRRRDPIADPEARALAEASEAAAL